MLFDLTPNQQLRQIKKNYLNYLTIFIFCTYMRNSKEERECNLTGQTQVRKINIQTKHVFKSSNQMID